MAVRRNLQLDEYAFTRLKIILSATLISLAIVSYCFANSHAVVLVSDPNLGIEMVIQGLKYPTAMAFLNSNEILVLEKDEGKVVRVVNGNISNNAVLSLEVNHVQEMGLLGISIEKEQHWNEGKKENSKYVYLFYTEVRNGSNANEWGNSNASSNCETQECMQNQFNNRLYRYEYKDGKLVNPKLLVDIPIYWNNRVYPKAYSAILDGGSSWLRYPLREGTHQGGKLVIDGDNNLFLVTGDGGGCFTDDGCYRSIKNGFLNVQTANKIGGDRPTGFGGILHVTNDGKPVINEGIIGDTIPLNYYYAYGIRNSFGLDIDPVSGKLWDTENGPHYGDEINLVEPGFNSGWAKIQGVWPIVNYTYLYSNSTEKGYQRSSIVPKDSELEDFDGKGHYSDPEFTWNQSIGVTSIKFLDTDKYGKQYKNDMLVGDVYGRIYHFDMNENRTGLNLTGSLNDKIVNSPAETSDLIFAQGLDTITDMQIGPDGFLYILSYNGKIFKLFHKVTME